MTFDFMLQLNLDNSSSNCFLFRNVEMWLKIFFKQFSQFSKWIYSGNIDTLEKNAIPKVTHKMYAFLAFCFRIHWPCVLGVKETMSPCRNIMTKSRHKQIKASKLYWQRTNKPTWSNVLFWCWNFFWSVILLCAFFASWMK